MHRPRFAINQDISGAVGFGDRAGQPLAVRAEGECSVHHAFDLCLSFSVHYQKPVLAILSRVGGPFPVSAEDEIDTDPVKSRPALSIDHSKLLGSFHRGVGHMLAVCTEGEESPIHGIMQFTSLPVDHHAQLTSKFVLRYVGHCAPVRRKDRYAIPGSQFVVRLRLPVDDQNQLP